ncbi:formate dehydrogenase accessory sulfurtransferase FdhD [Desulfitibacter alkalitolerans]|uniref:formate dehydrogenase accessory sulfurtransferase FdhD n=1 Tax=Desulfitibacter alkalitolerans TaxID=264641 RepID=UPI000481C370|nr:formate dehydrogenase accessory sulfurtransferase FdhD [Desulfitibacter alkalitolerans]
MKTKMTIFKYNSGIIEEMDDIIAEEKPITIYLNGEEVVTLLCTPEYLQDLAVGFLTAEGLLSRDSDTKTNLDLNKGIVWVEGSQTSKFGKLSFAKRLITTGCGKGTSMYHYHSQRKPVTSHLEIPVDVLFAGLKAMHSRSDLYQTTGGVHSSALMSKSGDIIVFREDVGRHNAADKILGFCLNNNIVLEDKVFLTSGRISSEIVGKVAQMEIPILVSRAAPTTLAIDLAKEFGLTVTGFVRGRRANIYSNPQRIKV